jgi:hypothetical protein
LDDEDDDDRRTLTGSPQPPLPPSAQLFG